MEIAGFTIGDKIEYAGKEGIIQYILFEGDNVTFILKIDGKIVKVKK